MVIYDLVKMCQQAIELSKQQFEMLNIMVNNIINNKVTDYRTIEHVFDLLLDVTYILGDQTRNLYYKLLEYYKTIDVLSSMDYEKYYFEIVGENEDISAKLLKKEI